jgi:hypothetical protein
MTTSRKENWLKFISDLPSNQSTNDHMADVLGSASYGKSANQISEQISKNPGLAVLLVDGVSELVILHSLDCLPANLWRSDNRLVALQGPTAKADCYRIDPVSAFSDLEFQTPLWRDLKSASSKDAIYCFATPGSVNTKFQGKADHDYSSFSICIDFGSKHINPCGFNTITFEQVPRV